MDLHLGADFSSSVATERKAALTPRGVPDNRSGAIGAASLRPLILTPYTASCLSSQTSGQTMLPSSAGLQLHTRPTSRAALLNPTSLTPTEQALGLGSLGSSLGGGLGSGLGNGLGSALAGLGNLAPVGLTLNGQPLGPWNLGPGMGPGMGMGASCPPSAAAQSHEHEKTKLHLSMVQACAQRTVEQLEQRLVLERQARNNDRAALNVLLHEYNSQLRSEAAARQAAEQELAQERKARSELLAMVDARWGKELNSDPKLSALMQQLREGHAGDTLAAADNKPTPAVSSKSAFKNSSMAALALANNSNSGPMATAGMLGGGWDMLLGGSPAVTADQGSSMGLVLQLDTKVLGVDDNVLSLGQVALGKVEPQGEKAAGAKQGKGRKPRTPRQAMQRQESQEASNQDGCKQSRASDRSESTSNSAGECQEGSKASQVSRWMALCATVDQETQQLAQQQLLSPLMLMQQFGQGAGLHLHSLAGAALPASNKRPRHELMASIGGGMF